MWARKIVVADEANDIMHDADNGQHCVNPKIQL